MLRSRYLRSCSQQQSSSHEAKDTKKTNHNFSSPPEICIERWIGTGVPRATARQTLQHANYQPSTVVQSLAPSVAFSPHASVSGRTAHPWMPGMHACRRPRARAVYLHDTADSGSACLTRTGGGTLAPTQDRPVRPRAHLPSCALTARVHISS